MPKFRHRKVKRQHHVLEALEPGLAVLAALDDVQSVIPGPIKPKNGGAVGFSLSYATATGLKLIGRSSGAAQEVFVVTRRPDRVAAELVRLGVLSPRSDSR
jgi:hypothetical protein